MPLLTSTMLHKGVRLSTDTSDLSRRNINIVHVKRPQLAAVVHEQPGRLLTKPMVRVSVTSGSETLCQSLSALHGRLC
jgi:hypothetical protein